MSFAIELYFQCHIVTAGPHCYSRHSEAVLSFLCPNNCFKVKNESEKVMTVTLFRQVRLIRFCLSLARISLSKYESIREFSQGFAGYDILPKLLE